jgi:hypothetical protein
MKRRQIFFHYVQVRPANPASNDPEQDVSGFKRGPGNVRDLKERRRRYAPG